MADCAPGSAEALCALVVEAGARGEKLELRGGGSKVEFGAPRRDARAVSMAGFSGVVDYDPPELVLTVWAGTPLAEISALVAREGQGLAFAPFDHGAIYGRAVGAATIGGVVAAGVLTRQCLGRAMAVTHGHGNPNWNRDETILALEAYFALAGKNPSAKDPQIIALLETLRALPYHGEAARKPTFRNPDGAAFKVQNLRSRETGKGLGNVSQMDRDIWDEFAADPAEVKRLATLIRTGIAANHRTALPEVDDAEDIEFYEGRLLTQSRIRRERSSSLRKALLKKRQGDDLRCDVCGMAHAALPPELRAAAFGAHHVVPISKVGEGTTKLSDVAVICAT